VFGTGASTDGTTTVDLSVDTPDLSGVSAGDLMWVQASSGYQYSVIASVDDGADTVTCDETFTNTEGSLTWAIGGKRKTLEGSARLFSDWVGWTVELSDGYTETLTQSLDLARSGLTTVYNRIKAVDGYATKPVLTWTNNGYGIWAKYYYPLLRLEDLDLRNTSVSKTSAIAIRLNTGSIVVRNVDINHATDNFDDCVFADSFGTTVFENCNFSPITNGIYGATNTTRLYVENCSFISGVRGIYANGGNYKEMELNRCIFSGQTTSCVESTSGDFVCAFSVDSCVFHDSTDGIKFNHHNPIFVRRSIFVDMGGYGVNFYGTENLEHLRVVDCAFLNSVSGNVTGGSNIGGVQLTADPFTNSSSEDFSLNDTAGGGATLKAETRTVASTTIYPFNWLTSASGGGATRLINGGLIS